MHEKTSPGGITYYKFLFQCYSFVLGSFVIFFQWLLFLFYLFIYLFIYLYIALSLSHTETN